MQDRTPQSTRSLPDHPNLRHLKDEAKAFVRAGEAASLAEAQFEVARSYGFQSWPKLKAHVNSLEATMREVAALKRAIDSNDLDGVKILMTRNPELHRAPLGYGNNGPLTWVAECRVPWEAPSTDRLAMAQWMIDNGSDVHQGGDGPLMRAALVDQRIPMMELLVRNGANVNAEWDGHFPIVFAPCETLEPQALKWLLDHGADPNCRDHGYGLSAHTYPGTALDYLIAGYVRNLQSLRACIEVLLQAGGETRFDTPGVLALLRGRLDDLAGLIDEDPAIVNKRFSELDCGQTGGRSLLLRGGTLLHVASEYRCLEAAKLLVERGADVNAHAEVDESGVGGQTPIFHAASQSDSGLPMVEYLVENGADLSVRAKIPGHYERPEEVVECSPLEYARLFPGTENRTVAFLAEAESRGHARRTGD